MNTSSSILTQATVEVGERYHYWSWTLPTAPKHYSFMLCARACLAKLFNVKPSYNKIYLSAFGHLWDFLFLLCELQLTEISKYKESNIGPFNPTLCHYFLPQSLLSTLLRMFFLILSSYRRVVFNFFMLLHCYWVFHLFYTWPYKLLTLRLIVLE